MVSASQDFINAMKSPIKQMYVKLELYEKDGITFIKEITQQVANSNLGSITCDSSQPVRRSFSFSLLNNNNEFDFGENNLIWINKRIKLYIGLKLANGSIEYIPQGVFILSTPQDSHDTNGKLSTIVGNDKAWLLTGNRGKFTTQLTISTGANIASAIKTIASDIGETLFNFDSNITTTVPYDLTYSANTSRWDAITELAGLALCDVYYDVNGYLRLKQVDFTDYDNDPSTWTYTYGDNLERFYAGNTRKFDESQLANHIIAIGGSSSTATCSYELVVDETNSIWTGNPYSIQQIGDLVYFHNNGNPDGAINSVQDAKNRCKFELMHRLGFIEDLTIDISPNFLHEVNDFIDIEDSENSVTGKYKINSFQIPLTPQLMTMTCQKYRQILSDWSAI